MTDFLISSTVIILVKFRTMYARPRKLFYLAESKILLEYLGPMSSASKPKSGNVQLTRKSKPSHSKDKSSNLRQMLPAALQTPLRWVHLTLLIFQAAMRAISSHHGWLSHLVPATLRRRQSMGKTFTCAPIISHGFAIFHHNVRENASYHQQRAPPTPCPRDAEGSKQLKFSNAFAAVIEQGEENEDIFPW